MGLHGADGSLDVARIPSAPMQTHLITLSPCPPWCILSPMRSATFFKTALSDHGPGPWSRTLWAVALLAAAWMLAVLPLRWAGLAVLGGAAGLFLVRWPWLVWPGLAAALPIAAGIKIGPVSGLDIGLALAVGLWLADGTRRRSLAVRGSLPLALLLLFIATQLAALPGAADLGEAVVEVVKWVEFAVVLLLAGPMLGQNRVHWLVIGLLLGGAGQALLGLWQFVNRIGPDFFLLFDRFMRAYGSFAQPNPYAGYLGLTLPVAVSLVFLGRQKGSSKGREAKTVAGWVLYGAFSGLIGAGLLASWSRGGWLGAAAAIGVVLVVRSRRAALLTLAAGVVLAGAVGLGALNPTIVPAPLADRVADIPAYFGAGLDAESLATTEITDANFSVMERLAHWLAALRMWEQSPWLGIGPGNYAVVYDSVRLPQWTEALGHAHNIYLNTLAESGLVGLMGFILLWGGLLIWVWGRVKLADGWERALAVGLLGVLAHLAVHSFFDNLFVQGMYLHLALWIAALMAATGQPEKQVDH